MLVNLVFVHVRKENIDDFKGASLKNAFSSGKEPGIDRFEVLQENDDPSRFILIEVFRDPDAPARHKETAHYAEWKETVTPMMAEERRTVKCVLIESGEKEH